MNLGEIRALVLANIFEDGRSPLTTAQANSYVNLAMQDTYTWMVGLNAGLLSRTVSTTGGIANLAGALEVVIPDSVTTPHTTVNKAVRARRIGAPSMQDPSLEIIDVSSTPLLLGGTSIVKPAVFVMSQKLYILHPADQLNYEITYVPYLSDMVVDADIPGRSNGTGDTTLWPLPWQTPIVTLATIYILARENQDATFWAGVLTAQRASLAQTTVNVSPATARS